MKRLIITGLWAHLFVLISPSWAMQELAKVTQVTGEAKIQRGSGSFSAQTEVTLKAGDKILTEASSSVDIAFNDLAGSRVLASSECVISDAGIESMRLDLKKGNMILNLEKLPKNSKFTVETPTAIAGVRGTQFLGHVEDTDNSPMTTFAVREGSVQVTAKNTGRTFLLIKGQALDIPKDSAKIPVIREALKKELEAIAQTSSIKTKIH